MFTAWVIFLIKDIYTYTEKALSLQTIWWTDLY